MIERERVSERVSAVESKAPSVELENEWTLRANKQAVRATDFLVTSLIFTRFSGSPCFGSARLALLPVLLYRSRIYHELSQYTDSLQ